jgi:hypothetical protein
MPKAYDTWKVHPHGPIEKLSENLWWVQGSLPGMSLKRTMVVARLGDGRLVVHNGIALEESAMRQLEEWGKPSWLIVPNGWHRLDAAAYKARYPELSVLCPRNSRSKVEEVVHVDGTYEDFPPDDAVRLEMIEGVGGMEGKMLVRSGDGVSLVLTDAVFNMDKKKDIPGYVFTTLLGSAPGPRVSRLAKALLVKDRKALRGELERLAAIPELRRLIVAHEKVAVGSDAASALRAAATYL